MGRSAVDACIDSRFRVFGLDALRVDDMNITPFVPRYVKANACGWTCLLIVPKLPHPVDSIHLRRARKRGPVAGLWFWRRDEGKIVKSVLFSYMRLCLSINAVRRSSSYS